MLLFALALAVIGGFIIHVMTPAERDRARAWALGLLGHAHKTVVQAQAGRDPFADALHQRTPLAVVTPAILIIYVSMFIGVIISPGSTGDALVDWGGHFGPRTTNGEWWRLVTATFAHAGLLHLLASIAGIAQIGLIVERLVGPVAFAAVYVSAGVLGSIVMVATTPMSVSVGASAAIFGIYGLFAASTIWSFITPSTLRIPLNTLKAVAPAAGIFILHAMATSHLSGGAELAGFAAGFVSGLVLTRDVAARTPSLRVALATIATAFVLAAVSAVAFRGIADIRPEIERIVALEEKTANIYQKAVAQFRLGAMNATSLAQLIDRAILPEVRAARARLEAIEGVPREHEALMASAEEYLRLRDESWSQRSDALHKANMPALRTAERTEHASLEALERIRPGDSR